MPNIKINTTDISGLKLGSIDVNYVYNATSLVWQRAVGVINFETNIDLFLIRNDQSKYITEMKLKI